MEEWYRIVRNLKDESEDSYLTQQFVNKVYHELRTKRIKDKGKFRQRMGPEFDEWTLNISQKFPVEMVMEIINDDIFWLETLKVTHI